jgi:catechol 2,3-dioxygenase-like lactoylglutathione lyase family enzyme
MTREDDMTAYGTIGEPGPAPGSQLGQQSLAFHHVGVQASDLDLSIAWYTAFFGAQASWTLTDFSPLTRSRLPGISRLVELVSGPLRFHLFARAGVDAGRPGPGQPQFQHLCIEVGSSAELAAWRDRWLAVAGQPACRFGNDELPTEIVIDSDGVESFYCLDPDGLEFEFTFASAAGR